MAKVFDDNAPHCPNCPNGPMVWDEDEHGWYCLNCGYFENVDEDDEGYIIDEENISNMFEVDRVPETFKELILNIIMENDEITYERLKERVLKEVGKTIKLLIEDGEIYEPNTGTYRIL
jgi:ribosomal protein S27AE